MKVDGGEGAGGAKVEEGRDSSRSGNRVPVSPNEKEERVEMRIGGAAVALERSSELSLRRGGGGVMSRDCTDGDGVITSCSVTGPVTRTDYHVVDMV